MGSEENYLDNLLKSMEAGTEAPARGTENNDAVSMNGMATFDDVATLTEDEMEKMIAQAASMDEDTQEVFDSDQEASVEDIRELLQKEQDHELVDEDQIVFSQDVEKMDSDMALDVDRTEHLMENDISELLSLVGEQIPTREGVEKEQRNKEKQEAAERKRMLKEEQKEKKRQEKLQKQRIKEEKKREKAEKREKEKQIKETENQFHVSEQEKSDEKPVKENGLLFKLFGKKKKDDLSSEENENPLTEGNPVWDFDAEALGKETKTGEDNIVANGIDSANPMGEEAVLEDAFQQSIQELLATDGFAEIDVNEIDPSTIIPEKSSSKIKKTVEMGQESPIEVPATPDDTIALDEEETIDLSNLASSDNADIAELLREASELNEIGKDKKEFLSDLSEENGEAAETSETEIVPEGKKASLWSKLMNFLFEEVEDDEEQQASSDSDDLPTGKVSEENQAILDSMEEEGKGKKKKKPKKEKKKKKTKGEEQTKSEGEEESEEGDASGKSSKGKKGKKEKKSKKEKKPKKIKVPDEEPANKLPKKKVKAVILFSISLLAILLLFCLLIPSNMETKTARQAYYDGKYEETYQAMYGKKLSEKDKKIFRKSGILLRMQRKLDLYQYYKDAGKDTEALNALIQGVAKYYEVKEEAEELGIPNKVKKKYIAILDLLHTEYNVPEYEAILVSELEDDEEYAKAVHNIAKGLLFNATSEEDVREELEPLVPEEEIIEEDTEPEEEGNLLFRIFSK